MPTQTKPNKATQQTRIDEMHRCRPEKTALLVVDMQHGFLDPGASLEVPKGRAIIPNLRRLIVAFRANGAPVIFTQFFYSPAVPCLRGDPFGVEHLPASSGEAPGFGRRSSNCLIGPNAGQEAESADIILELAPQPDELIIAGHTYDKFYGTPLELALHSRGITHLVITGVTTDVCVNCTVLSASNRNYRVTVVTDGVATLDDNLQEACLRIWQRKFARLRDTKGILAEIKGTNRPGKDKATSQA